MKEKGEDNELGEANGWRGCGLEQEPRAGEEVLTASPLLLG